jgi:hypothetical protein
MNEPHEFSEYLNEVNRALRGRGKRRREILEELRGHLLDEIEEAVVDQPSIKRVLDRFGPPETIAGGFNDVLRDKRLRVARMVLAASAISMVGGLATYKALTPSRDQVSPSPIRVESAARFAIGRTNIIAIVPSTGEAIRISRHS